jgi:heptosyltransferase-3
MRILAIQLNQPGDAILTTPALRWLMNQGHEVHGLLQPAGAQLLQAMPGLASVDALARGSIQVVRDFRRTMRLRRLRFDWAIVFSKSSDRPALWAALSGAAKRTGLDSGRGTHLGRIGLINDWVKNHALGLPIAEHHLALAGAPPGASYRLSLEYHPPESEREWAREWMHERNLAGGRYLLLHATARWPSKYWPMTNLIEFIRGVKEKLKMPVVVTSGRESFEVGFMRELIECAPCDYHEIGTLTVNQLGALIENAAGFVGVDSMPMHLAAALSKPGVALFGPTDEKMWGPWHSKLAVLRRDCRCLREHARSCPKGPASLCMAELPAELVLEKLAQILGVS